VGAAARSGAKTFVRMLAVAAAASLLAGCAGAPSANPKPDPFGAAIRQPMRDLSLIRDQSPATLQAAVQGPYAYDRAATCAALAREIAALDAVLGPDVDLPSEAKGLGDSLAADLIGGAFGLPYRGILRTVTGAAQRDRDLKAAILAGMVRRGFLKGRQSTACVLVATTR
jgi:hypothetical protein